MINLDDPERAQFSVAVFYLNGTHAYVVRFVDGRRAVLTLHKTIAHALRSTTVTKVIITDGGDNTNIEWTRGEGFTFPPQLKGYVPKPASEVERKLQ